MRRFDVAIVGAGHAGAQAAAALRQNGFAGSIALFGEEADIPYDRPSLSKEYLAGEKPFERMPIRSQGFWEERDITLLLGRRVTEVNPIDHSIIAGHECFGYRSLIWATGGHARRLSCSGHDLAGVHSIRSRADVDLLASELAEVKRVAIVGGGYIGLEAAAVMTKLGKQVVLFEALDRVLARVAGEPLSRFYEAEHRAKGVEIRLGVQVEAIEGEARVTGVRLSSGEVVAADLVIVGIGIIPAVEPLLVAGAAGNNGVLVDAQCRTSLIDILAVGDCALHANRFAEGALIRLESVQNASDQASVAAKVVAGVDANYDAMPWFWSNQYDLRLQTVGLSGGHDHIVLRGAPETRSFSIAYLREGRLIALDCVNATKDYVQGRALIAAGFVPDPHRLADTSVPLKDQNSVAESVR